MQEIVSALTGIRKGKWERPFGYFGGIRTAVKKPDGKKVTA